MRTASPAAKLDLSGAVTKEALKKATVWVSHESIKEWRATRAHPLVEFVGSVRESIRESLGSLQMPQPPRWMEQRKEQAVRFVSARRSHQLQHSRLTSSHVTDAVGRPLRFRLGEHQFSSLP